MQDAVTPSRWAPALEEEMKYVLGIDSEFKVPVDAGLGILKAKHICRWWKCGCWK